MAALAGEAKGFVDSIISYISQEGKQGTAVRVAHLLTRVSREAKREKAAQVTTSVNLDNQEKTRIEKLLFTLLDHRVEVTYVVDPKIIAGVTIRVADWVLDTSFSGQLVRLREALSG